MFATAKSKTAEPYTQTLISMANQAGQKRFYGLNKEKILQIVSYDIVIIIGARISTMHLGIIICSFSVNKVYKIIYACTLYNILQ